MTKIKSRRSLAQHESEWIYSTIISRQLKLSSLNDHIHQISHVPLVLELFIFSCGYAFNPIMVPFWLALVNLLTCTPTDGLSDALFSRTLADRQWETFLLTINSNKIRGHVNMSFYLSTVLVTLLFTELGKASFATTRPKIPTNVYSTKTTTIIDESNSNHSIKWNRRFGSLVASLKSKHSFPSGDCAQCMNLCLFFLRYVPTITSTTALVTIQRHTIAIRDIALILLFLPGVAFARVFYLCHWIEDCIGGIALSFMIHWLIIPVLKVSLIDLARSFVSIQ